MASLTISNLNKSFGSVAVLQGIDLEVKTGEFVVLVGPSGCGKSTLLAMIAGLESISAGEIRIGERLVNDVPPKDRDIAMVFQSYALYPTMTVRANITFGMESRGVPKQAQAKALASVAGLLQIESLLGRKPSQLSGGQRQRVAMGRALVRDPALFLFDPQPPAGMRLMYPYFAREVLIETETGSYAALDSGTQVTCHSFAHPLADILGSLLRAGLRIISYDEYPLLRWQGLPWMTRRDAYFWELPAEFGEIPMMFSLTATR